MATIRKRGNKYQVQIRKLGYETITKTFTNKKDAELYAKQTEVDLERGILPTSNKAILKSTTLRDIVIRYRETVTVHKKGRDIEVLVLSKFLKHSICDRTLDRLATEDFAKYRDERLQEVKPQTLRKQLTPIKHALTLAKKEWGIPLLVNPLDDLVLKSRDHKRQRRLLDGELDLILDTAREHTINPYIIPIILLAIETAMRRGELLSIKWDHIDFKDRSLHIPDTKNGEPRTIPLTDKAIDILGGLQRHNGQQDGIVFPITPNAFRQAWRRIISRSGIKGLVFHDLRREAISRFFEMGLNIPEVRSISGHKNVQMLFVYTAPKPQDILRKINQFK